MADASTIRDSRKRRSDRHMWHCDNRTNIDAVYTSMRLNRPWSDPICTIPIQHMDYVESISGPISQVKNFDASIVLLSYVFPANVLKGFAGLCRPLLTQGGMTYDFISQTRAYHWSWPYSCTLRSWSTA